jgi:16S rRNA processing protein RimM
VPGRDKVCLGVVVGAHGVRGTVRIKSFTAKAQDIAAYGALSDESGSRRFEATIEGFARGAVLARLSGVSDRDAAEALRGLRLYVPRSALPATKEDEYYHADLIGLPVETKSGAQLGTVRAVHNFGAGDILELRGVDGREIMLPFSAAAVPEVDVGAGRIVADPPAGLLEERSAAGIAARGGAAVVRHRPRRRGVGRRGGGAAGL